MRTKLFDHEERQTSRKSISLFTLQVLFGVNEHLQTSYAHCKALGPNEKDAKEAERCSSVCVKNEILT